MKSLAERVCLRLRIINMNKAELAWQFDKEGMKCSRSMLSQYLNGKYLSRPVKLEERLERWLEETEEQEAAFRQENRRWQISMPSRLPASLPPRKNRRKRESRSRCWKRKRRPGWEASRMCLNPMITST